MILLVADFAPPRARRLCAGARRVLSLVSPAAAPPPARPLLRIARLIARPDAGSRAARPLGGAQPARPLLHQARPVPRHASRCRRRFCGAGLEVLQDRMPPFGQDVAEKIVSEALDVRCRWPFPISAPLCGRLHRGSASGPCARRGGTRLVAVKVLRPTSPTAFPPIWRAFAASPPSPKNCFPRRAACAWKRWWTRWRALSPWKWTCCGWKLPPMRN